MTIRPYEPRDAESVVAMFNAVAQEPETAESLRHRFAKFPASLPSIRLVAEAPNESGDPRVVAYANAVASGPEGAWSFLTRVHADANHQGKGLGRALLGLVEAFAWENGAKRLMSQVRDDLDRELRFAQNAGYTEVQHLVGVVLDLALTPSPQPPPPPRSSQGEGEIHIVSFASLGDTSEHRRKLFELYYETDADTPGIEMWGQDGYDGWANIFRAKWFSCGGVFCRD